jgi:hypothetical protein
VAAAVRGAKRNGVRLRASDVRFGGTGFAPTRVAVKVRGSGQLQRQCHLPALLPTADEAVRGHLERSGCRPSA